MSRQIDVGGTASLIADVPWCFVVSSCAVLRKIVGLNYFYSLHLLLKPVPPFHVVKTILTVSRPMGCYMAYTPAVCDSSLNIYIYIYAQTGTFADPTVQRFELFFPFEAGVRFFFWFQEAFASCGSSQSSASGWKAFEGLTLNIPGYIRFGHV